MTGTINVYLIDDDEAVLDALGLYLESKGLNVHRFTRAAPAIDAIRTAKWPACVVSDVRMPGMSGLGLQKELAQQACTLPVILITGHGHRETTFMVGSVSNDLYTCFADCWRVG